MSQLPGSEFDEKAFADTFIAFDEDGSGTIEKSEFVGFLKKMLGQDIVDALAAGGSLDSKTMFSKM